MQRRPQNQGMDKTPPKITVGKISLAQAGDKLIISHHGKDRRIVSVTVEAEKLERWAMRILREEAFA